MAINAQTYDAKSLIMKDDYNFIAHHYTSSRKDTKNAKGNYSFDNLKNMLYF
ncbi:MAG: hypothetical protein KJ799_07525 [Bacteroidetes bacterium]|nr:hypothetical protein [Bacteroidota bacterium]MBU1680990.1 hypothetical protein [Bacteroidota bacterium]MBU2506557.1 hypothetical protein [Bacteroidota bacterium]